MATIRFINGKSNTELGRGYTGYKTLRSLKDVLDYIKNPEKTSPMLIGGLNCNPELAYEEMVLCKQVYGKDVEDNKNRMLIHFTQNFAPGESNPEEVNEIAKKLLKHPLFEGFQVCYATHTNTKHLHTHFVVNTVNLETGEKWHLSKRQLQELKDYSDELLREHGLSIVPEPTRERKANSYNSQCQVRMERLGTSWKKEIYLAVKNCLFMAKSRDEFIHEMNKLGYQVEWKDERKYITFINADGKKLRNKKLYPNSQFTKEAMEKRFELNKQWDEIQKEREVDNTMNLACNVLRLVNSLNKNGEKYPFQKIEKDYSSEAAKGEFMKEVKKGKGLDWERE